MVKVILYRLQLELKCIEQWPMYVTHEEDMECWQEKWNKEFSEDSPPVIMHNTTCFVELIHTINKPVANQVYCVNYTVGSLVILWLLGTQTKISKFKKQRFWNFRKSLVKKMDCLRFWISLIKNIIKSCRQKSWIRSLCILTKQSRLLRAARVCWEQHV